MQNDLDEEGEGQEHPAVDRNQIETNLMNYFNHDLILLPFFFDDEKSKQNHKHVYYKNPESD